MISKEEQEHIKAFVENKPMAEAVQKAVFALIAAQGNVGNIDTTLDDAEYGRAVKAATLASKWLVSAFGQLVQIAKTPAAPKRMNEAR